MPSTVETAVCRLPLPKVSARGSDLGGFRFVRPVSLSRPLLPLLEALDQFCDARFSLLAMSRGLFPAWPTLREDSHPNKLAQVD